LDLRFADGTVVRVRQQGVNFSETNARRGLNFSETAMGTAGGVPLLVEKRAGADS
jgi:hypothetical protein